MQEAKMGDHKKAELALGKYLSFDGLSLSNISDYYFAATPGASLSGGGGDEVFFANSDATNAASLTSTMNGGGGDDTFVAGAARETFKGSTGSDFFVYKDSPTGVSVDLLNGIGYLGWAAGDHYNSVEGAVGSPFQDVLVGNNGANILDGGAGSDLIDGGGGADVLIGGAGEDRIYGFFSGEGDGGALPHTGFSQIFGGAGNDTIFASAEAEHIDGGTGLLDHVELRSLQCGRLDQSSHARYERGFGPR
jgi:Ca2+-binding RTX toxin-like protein